ncbi:hypothetical protein MLD38_000450 [Melastoma candidum]|uniref:Uncharacterized protein n=1 Tax=Melastoma candidum TaxID=119954 RepID=A0ACB9SB17_9MYRT|nr:hypothetical protein MLD38_000450 [Melastoma candidum]
MSKSLEYESRESTSSMFPQNRESSAQAEMDDVDDTMATIASFVERLHSNMSSSNEKELITARLLAIAKERKEARMLIGSHSQAMPLFISILRSGTTVPKVNVATILSILCKDDELRLRVLLGGCIPPLLSMLKSQSVEVRRAAAEAIYEVSSGGMSGDHVGMKIFVMERVVPRLWDQLNPENEQDKVVEGFVIGALRNLCGEKDGYWRATLDSDGVAIIIGLLSSDNAAAQSNAAALLARLMLAFNESIPKVIDSGAVKVLLQLIGRQNDISVRASAADALQALSSEETLGRKAVVDAGGIPLLIGAVVAPSKECLQGKCCHSLQAHATQALANVCCGMAALITYLGKLSQSSRLIAPVSDVIGALAYALMVYDGNAASQEEPFKVSEIERTLVLLLEPQEDKLVQERVLEAMASLYGNPHLSEWISHADTKRVLIGLTTMAAADVREHLILSLTDLCRDGIVLWDSIGKREGMQLLISLLGLATEQQQEYAVQLLAILTDQVDDSKWAITAAGGIPPLVQLLESGSQRTKEEASHIIWNLCCHSNDIRACIESAGAVPALIYLLRSGGEKVQEASAKALMKLVKSADSPTINQLLALLLGDSPINKTHIIRVLGHVLGLASERDLVSKGSAANQGLIALVEVLNSSNEENQESAASVLADFFGLRHDICDSLATEDIAQHCIKLLTSNTSVIATQSARALGALSRPTKSKATKKMPYIMEGDVKPLIDLAKSSSIDTAETAVAALANLFSNLHIAAEALAEDVVSALMRVLDEGSVAGKMSSCSAFHQLLKNFAVYDVLKGNENYRFTVLTIFDALSSMDLSGTDVTDALEVIALLASTKQGSVVTHPPRQLMIAEDISSLESVIRCLSEGPPLVQDKATEVLSILCGDQPKLFGDLIISHSASLSALVNRIIKSSSSELRVRAATLLICAAKENKQQSLDILESSGMLRSFVYALVDMIKHSSNCSFLEIRARPRSFFEKTIFQEGKGTHDVATISGGTVALWLLSIISVASLSSRVTVVEAGALDTLVDGLAHQTAISTVDKNREGLWISALVLAILLQETSAALSVVAVQSILPLAQLLQSDIMIDRFFGAQAMASLVRHGDKGINLAIANSGAIAGLISLIGYMESEMPDLIALSDEFALSHDPEQVVLEHLFDIEDVKRGSIATKSIPLLVDILRPMPDRPGAPSIAVKLLTSLAFGYDANKLVMAEAGAVDALTRYLSLGPQDSTEAMVSDLLRMLFSHPEVIQYEASASSLKQLLAVLRLGSRNSRLSAARALHELFNSENIRDSDLACQSIHPLVDMLNSLSENEQETALAVLIKFTSGNSSRIVLLNELQGKPLECLHRMLSAAPSLELKTKAAELCFFLFGDGKLRAEPIASECIPPLIALIQSSSSMAIQFGVCALERLLETEHQVEYAASFDIVNLLVSFVSGTNDQLIEASICTLIKLGKDRTPLKLDMVKAGVIDNCLQLIPTASSSLGSSVAELFRILTNSSAIARGSAAASIVKPLFTVLQRPDFTLWGQHSALQALVNILEKPQSLAILELTPSQAIEPLISLLESPSLAIQQLGTELLSHLLAQEHFQQDITTKNAVVPLVRLAGIGVLNLQKTAIKALEKLSKAWPKAVVLAGGIFELSKVIKQDDPQPPHALWESAALVLCNIMRASAKYYFKVDLGVLVRMLHSTVESTVTAALNGLILYEKNYSSSAEQMTDAGAINALVDLLRSHQCEEACGGLLESLFNNPRVREKKASKHAIAPLSQYLLDPQTRSESGRLLVALSLGNLSQHERLARASDSVSACCALVSLLEDQPTEEMTMVAICALQNFVMHSRTNRRAVAEAGGILVIQELLLSPSIGIARQAAMLTKFLFSNHTLQEYVSNELIRSLTAALERELWSSEATNNEVLTTLNVIFANFPKLHISEAATLCIPHLVNVLKSGVETSQESALDTLYQLKQSWAMMDIDIAKSQAMIASEAIPLLQELMKICPPNLHDRVDGLLHCLPGCLTVTVKRGNNLKQAVGSTSAFCQLTLGNTPPRQTKVVNHSTSPEWNEAFTWNFDVPPKGQKLHIICKSKNTFGKVCQWFCHTGKLTIQIDKVVAEGEYSGPFSLNHEKSKDGCSRTLEIGIIWSKNAIEDEEEEDP